MERRTAIKNTTLLIGTVLGGVSIPSLMQSCQEQNRLDWKPIFFTEKQAEVVSEITETLLPRTVTPGAKDLKVDLFVDLMFGKTLSPQDQAHVMKGYDRFMEICQEKFGKDFTDLEGPQRNEVLRLVEKETNKFNPTVWGSTLGEQPPIDFYRRLKQFALAGYFTSEEVGKNILKYDPIPGDYKGCVPYNGGNTWSF